MLILVFLMTTMGLFALFLGGGLVAQGYLYQNPAARMPLRALAGAVLVAGFITLWVRIDRNAPGRYDTFFNFSSYSTAEFDEFEAVRWAGAGDKLKLDASGNPTESTAKFKRAAGGKFVEEKTGKPFEMNGTTSSGMRYMVGAIRVKGPNDHDWVRYNVNLKDGKPKTNPEYGEPRRFVEEKGSRYVEVAQLGTLFIPSSGTIVIALFLNFMLFVVWLVAFWLILRFALTHALLFTGAFALLTMLAVMPILFKQNRAKPPAPTSEAALVFRQMEMRDG